MGSERLLAHTRRIIVKAAFFETSNRLFLKWNYAFSCPQNSLEQFGPLFSIIRRSKIALGPGFPDPTH
jgi:hypothetical protein